MKPKILHIVALDTVGGVEQLYAFYTHASAKAFSHFTLNDRSNIAPAFSTLIKQNSEEVRSIKRWHGLPVPKKMRSLYFTHCLKKMKPDLIVVWNKVEGFDLELVQDKTPVIYYEHGGGRASSYPEKAKQFLEKVDHIICVSEASKSLLIKKWHLSRNDIQVCLNPIRPECIPDKQNFPVEQNKPTANEIVLGIAGRLISNKGIPIVLHSLKQLLDQGYNVRLRIAGLGPEQDRFASLANTLSVVHSVEFLGNVTNMPEFYQSLNIFLYPSLNESFGLVAAEAGICRIPVIASAVGGLTEVITHKETGILINPELTTKQYQQLGANPDWVLQKALRELTDSEPLVAISPKKLTTAILSLINHPSIYDKMANAAYKKCSKSFSPSAFISTLNNTFTSVIEEK